MGKHATSVCGSGDPKPGTGPSSGAGLVWEWSGSGSVCSSRLTRSRARALPPRGQDWRLISVGWAAESGCAGNGESWAPFWSLPLLPGLALASRLGSQRGRAWYPTAALRWRRHHSGRSASGTHHAKATKCAEGGTALVPAACPSVSCFYFLPFPPASGASVAHRDSHTLLPLPQAGRLPARPRTS